MKLFHGTSAGLPLTGESSLSFGATNVLLDPSLAFAPGAIEGGRVLRADLSKDDAGRLLLIAERAPDDERALVVVELPFCEPGRVDYMSIRPERQFLRVFHPHMTRSEVFCPQSKRRRGPTSRYHVLLVLSEGTAVRFTATFACQSILTRLKRWMGMASRAPMAERHWRFGLENGAITLVERRAQECAWPGLCWCRA